jgi:hypothetical protein
VNRTALRAFLLAFVASLAMAFASRRARACGGFYAQDVEVSPDQEIVVVHRGGVETYIFRPHFCGVAKDFGVILPVPATLIQSPTLADNALYDDLDRFTAPEQIQICRSSGDGVGCGSSDEGTGAPGSVRFGNEPPPINVIQTGQVGQFDYVLLQATSVAAFTDWLDQNGYPHGAVGGVDPNADAYEYYVTKQWYFVAFKVTASTTAPPAGQRLCGDLGPIGLSFAAAQPVVPARIASVNVNASQAPQWRVFVIAAQQQRLASYSSFRSYLYFSGALHSTELSGYPALSTVARDGERLTVLNVVFPVGTGINEDIDIENSPTSTDFRTQTEVYVDCGGCTAAGGGAVQLVDIGLILGVPAIVRRIRRRRAARSAS